MDVAAERPSIRRGPHAPPGVENSVDVLPAVRHPRLGGQVLRPAAHHGDTVVFELEVSLNRGEILHQRGEVSHRIGRRLLIAGVEKALEGMCAGGYRKVRVSPHLAYGEGGVAGARLMDDAGPAPSVAFARTGSRTTFTAIRSGQVGFGGSISFRY